MYKNFFLISAFLLSSCASTDENYYRYHLKELQKALALCPAQKPSVVTCEQLEVIGKEVNILVYKLQQSPQHFGIKILDLQNQLAALKNQKNSPDSLKMEEVETQLKQHLAVIRWLESPES